MLDTLDKLFGKNNIDCQYLALKDLEKAERVDGQSIMEYLTTFEMKYILAMDLVGLEPYSDYMKAYKLIENVRLDDNSAKIVRGSIVKWEFNEAFTALKKIFGGDQSISSGESSLTGIKIKSEPQDVYYSSQYHKGQGRGSYSRGSYSRGSNTHILV